GCRNASVLLERRCEVQSQVPKISGCFLVKVLGLAGLAGMPHERKGLKRRLPCRDTTSTSGCSSPSPCSSVASRPRDDAAVGAGTEERPPPRWHNRCTRRQQQQQQQQQRCRGQHAADKVCGSCRRKNNTSAAPPSSLRLAGIVGIHVLGFIACPCQGFTPLSLSAGGTPSLATDGQQSRLNTPDFETRSGVVDGDIRARGLVPSLSVGAAAGGSLRAAKGRRRHRGGSRRYGGGLEGDGDASGVCRATRLPSAEEGPPIGLLYDRGLLEASAAAKGADTTSSNNKSRSRDGVGIANGGGDDNGGKAVAAANGSAMGTGGRGGKEGGRSAAPAASTPPVAPAVEMVRVESTALQAESSIAQDATDTQWGNVVDGTAGTAEAAAAAGGLSRGEVAAPAPPAKRKKWSGKGWLVSRAKEEAEGRAKSQNRAEATDAGLSSMAMDDDEETSMMPTVAAVETGREAGLKDTDLVNVEDGERREVDTGNNLAVAGADPSDRSDDSDNTSSRAVVVEPPASSTSAATAAAAATSLPSVDGKREGEDAASLANAAAAAAAAAAVDGVLVPNGGTASPLADEEEDTSTELEDAGGGVCATAKEELALYLLEAGATDDLVAMATAALFAAEPRCSLTEGTWKRWRQNLDGLRSKGFSGADVCNMLALCPQLLALDFEGQVVPTMELLRQLGMRPTDVRRVIRKAPEVLAPRPDGSTAAEAVDVLRTLGLRRRHLKMEAMRWPQLLVVPPGSFFQLAAFLASEEVGIKSTNIGSLIRQAPWLVLQPIDGQMLPVVRFLRIAGVVDVERVLRAYPKVLSASIRGELAPRVRFLWSDVGVSEEDLPRVLQTFPLVFALPLSRMKDVMAFLSEDLSISRNDIAKIIRAFPSLLGLERERHMAGVVRYLKWLGVQNVGRFVSRLPPVLGYDVETNLAPKMDYLVEKMGLSVYDVLTFPAYFSYPLDTVIEPRTEFLAIRGRPITLVGLNIALHQGDADFARKVARVQPRVYQDFKKAYINKRAAVKNGLVDAEQLLSGPQRTAIGSLGGLSTSNNLSAVPSQLQNCFQFCHEHKAMGCLVQFLHGVKTVWDFHSLG
ncbi:unnamed protein product, partial [Ectocarpus sp. 4 AP-2014]